MKNTQNPTIIINGAAQPLKRPTAIASLLQEQGYEGKLVAIAINGTFVSKSNYEKTYVNDQDKIEIVAPMQGG